MIALREDRPQTAQATPAQPAFEELLPAIRLQASFAFRFACASECEELVAEAVANAYCAYRRLVERGKTELAYATPLATFAVRQVRAGRRVGASMSSRDTMSESCRVTKRVKVERLDRYDWEEGVWQQVLVEDRRAGPAEIAASRIDFAAWLKTLSRRSRRIAVKLAGGETTSATARHFRVSLGRISQIRRELQDSWERFQGRLEMDAATA